MPTYAERFQRLAKTFNLSAEQIGEIFGVDTPTATAWYYGRAVPQREFRATLTRLEAETLPALSPHLRPETVKAFMEGRERAMAGK